MSFLVPRRSRRAAFPALRDVRGMNELFDDFWRGFGAAPWSDESGNVGFAPSIDVRETEKAIIVTAEVPGVEEKDFEVLLDDGVLTVKGEKHSEHEEERDGWHHIETTSGTFHRRVRLPCEVDADAVKATHKGGVVTIELPKLEEARARSRTIPVSTA